MKKKNKKNGKRLEEWKKAWKKEDWKNGKRKTGNLMEKESFEEWKKRWIGRKEKKIGEEKNGENDSLKIMDVKFR